MSDQVFQYLGRVFQVLHDDPRYPETKTKFVSEIWHDYPSDFALDVGEGGFYARVLGLFSNEGEAITAAKREVEYLRLGKELKP